MFARRRRYRSLDTNNNTIAEAAPAITLGGKTTPTEIPPPRSRVPSPVAGVASIAQSMPMSTASQEEPGPNRDREKSTREQVDTREEAGDHETVAHEATPVDKNSAEALDPIAEGHKKLAEFWPIYVKEADNFDRELSEGWNNMLDVILLFAALFSAISTAFVLVSSQDLKPDPAETAAATLLLISQTLLTMSNQSALAPASGPTEPAPFAPTSSAIAVNILWFSSLILSISVTLVAMLAKEWSYFFMVGRTGMPMEQARKRQKRFDGMKIWKMEGVVTALPTLMHLALFLFAAGLCVYLWDIHMGVAVPVVILTLLTVLIYVAALVLPLIHDYCPYATALSRLIKPYPGTWSRKRENQPELVASSDKVPMDATTSRTIAWMISNSEVPSSVDLSLQAIAGTSFEMPNEALWECKVSEAVYLRLRHRFDIPESGFFRKLTTMQLSKIVESDSSVLAYLQALNLMVSERRELSTAYIDVRDRPTRWLLYCDNLYDRFAVSSPLAELMSNALLKLCLV